MARYGTFKYGDGTKYGTTTTDNPVFALEVDWDNDGVYGGISNADRIREVEVSSGRQHKIKPSGDGFEYPKAGQMRVIMDNRDGEFDPFNTGGTYYGDLLPGRNFKLSASPPGGTGQVYLMTGIIKDIKPVSGRDDYVVITGEDRLALLRDHTYYATLLSGDTATDIIEDILTDAGFTSDDWDLDTDATDIVTYYWCDGQSALSAIWDIVDAFIGKFYITGDGIFHYDKYLHTYTTIGTITEDKMLKTIKMKQPWDVVRNYIQVRGYPQSIAASATVLWTAQDIPYVDAGESITIWGENISDGMIVPDGEPVTMVEGTDYIANTQEDGGGSTISSDITITETQFATRRKLVIQNDNAAKAYLTTLQYRGKAITSEATQVVEEDSTSQSDYGVRKFILDTPWLQNTNVIISHAETIKSDYADAEKYLECFFEQYSSAFVGGIFDRATLYLETLEVSTDYLIGYIKHNYKAGRGLLTTVLYEPFDDVAADYWQFTTQLGTTSKLG